MKISLIHNDDFTYRKKLTVLSSFTFLLNYIIFIMQSYLHINYFQIVSKIVNFCNHKKHTKLYLVKYKDLTVKSKRKKILHALKFIKKI